MIDRPTFDRIKLHHGKVASWAVWARRGPGMAWVADPHVLDPDKNPKLLDALKSNIVMLGLNQSGFDIQRDLSNFHQLNRGAGP